MLMVCFLNCEYKIVTFYQNICHNGWLHIENIMYCRKIQKLKEQQPGFYLNTFVYGCFPPKIQFLYCLRSSVTLWGGPMVDTKAEISEA